MRLHPDKRMKNDAEGKPRMDMYPRFFIVGMELPSESHPLLRKNASNPYRPATWIRESAIAVTYVSWLTGYGKLRGHAG